LRRGKVAAVVVGARRRVADPARRVVASLDPFAQRVHLGRVLFARLGLERPSRHGSVNNNGHDDCDDNHRHKRAAKDIFCAMFRVAIAAGSV
jgi:hypothetical protein